MRVLAFTGLPGSGKSVAVEAVRARGIPVVRMGDFVLDEVRRRGLPVEEEHIGPVASGMRREQGDDIWARRTVEAIQERQVPGITARTPIVAIDGVRSLAEVRHLKESLGDDFLLVAVHAPAPDRHARLHGRGRPDDVGGHDWAAERDRRERGWGLEEAMESADLSVSNDADIATFRRRVDALIKEILDE